MLGPGVGPVIKIMGVGLCRETSFLTTKEEANG